MILGMTFRQAIVTELNFSRSCLQNWFSTGHDFRFSRLVSNGFRTGLRAGSDFRAELTTVNVYRYGLSADHDLMQALQQSMTLGMAFQSV
jgi:hypothetical protein